MAILFWSLALLLSNVVAQEFPCSFKLDSHEFDLCPLVASQTNPIEITVKEETPPTRTISTYRISVNGALKRDGTLPNDLQCPSGTWICLEVKNTRPNRPSEPDRITQIVPIAVSPNLIPKAKYGAKINKGDTQLPLQVTLHGGMYTDRKQKASLQFICDHDTKEPTYPTFAWKFNGTHAFEWRSKHACGKLIPGGKSPSDPAEEPDRPPVDPDQGSEIIHDNRGATLFGFCMWTTAILISLFFLSKLLRKQTGLKTSHYMGRILLGIRGRLATNGSKDTLNDGLEAEFYDLPDEMPLSPRTGTKQSFIYGSVS